MSWAWHGHGAEGVGWRTVEPVPTGAYWNRHIFRVVVGNSCLGGHRRDGIAIYTAVIFRRFAVFSFLAVTTLAEAVKPKYGGIFSAVMQ